MVVGWAPFFSTDPNRALRPFRKTYTVQRGPRAGDPGSLHFSLPAMKEDQAYLATRHIVISVTKPNRFGLALGVIDVSYEYVSIEAIKRIMMKRL